MAFGFLGGVTGGFGISGGAAPVTGTPRPPAPDGPPPPSPAGAGTVDSVGSGEARGIGRATIQAGLEERKAREALIDGMLAKDTPLAGASPQELQSLHGDLGRVDTDVLRYASQNGIKVQVVHTGEDLLQAGVIRPQDARENERLLPERSAEARALGADIRKDLEEPIAALEKQKAAIAKRKGLRPDQPASFSAFGAPPDKDIAAIDGRIGEIRNQQEQAIGERVKDKPYKTFAVETPAGGAADGFAAMQAMNNRIMPRSTAEMATMHGALTPEEKAEFGRGVEALNGSRLTEARQEMLSQMERYAARSKDPAARKGLEDLRAHPENIPVDHIKHPILVPDTHYYRPEGASEQTPPLRLDGHDKGTMEEWTRPGGSSIEARYDTETHEGSAVVGQYFHLGDVNRMIVRSEDLSNGTPTHELGHGLQHLVEKQDPGFYKPWQERLDQSYHEAGLARIDGTRRAISEYSRVSPNEYFCEGFRFYHEDAQRLKTRDPQLFQLVDEMNTHAGQLGRQGAR